jgi:hypothetical protein
MGVGVEVGTFKGEFASTVASSWRCSTLHTCDPWKHYEGYVDGCVLDFGNSRKPIPMSELEAEARGRLAAHGSKVTIHKVSGATLLKEFVPGSLSFVYLDGNHAYEVVKAEMELAWRALSPGGLLGLHDTYYRGDEFQHCGVWPAVWEFAHDKNIIPHLTFCTSSWFLKP